MNKLLKVVITTLGGINTIFTTFIPTLLAIIIIDLVPLSQLNQVILYIAGASSTLYRALSYLVPVLEE